MNIKIEKKIRVLFFSFLIMFGGFLGSTPVLAESDDALTYTIAVEPVDNQIDKDATYYDLLVEPNMKEKLTVIVSNTGKETKKIRVTPTDAVTNQNGVIDYSIKDDSYKFDSTLDVPFTSLVGPEQIVEVGPGESKPVVFDLSIPEKEFKGTILGGFLADLPDEVSDKEDSSGVKIVNKFQLVKAVMLREKEDKVTPELVLNDVKASLVSYRTAVTANLQNTEPTMFGELTVDAKVTEKGKKEVIKSQKTDGMEMAPNSNFDFPIMWDNQPLEPGEYTLNLVATSGKKEWKFTKNFTITAEESDKLNKEAVDLEESETPYWIYLLIGIIVLLLLILIGIFIYSKRKKKKEEEEAKKRKQKMIKEKKKKRKKPTSSNNDKRKGK